MSNKNFKINIGSSSANTSVVVDDQKIGLIKELKIIVDASHLFPEIEVTFPDPTNPIISSFSEKIKTYVQLLEDIPGVKVKFADW